jgi:diamine N-acetyltransferase
MSTETSLREITKETVREITKLDVGPDQQGLVAPNSVSIAEAHFEPKAWFRAIYSGEEPAGFAMVWRDPPEGVFYVWRFMVDARYQGKGVGRRALELLIDEAKADGAAEVTLSVVPGAHSALGFYESFGFEPTGVVHGAETELRLTLDDSR